MDDREIRMALDRH
jgi:hypothetical protein